MAQEPILKQNKEKLTNELRVLEDQYKLTKKFPEYGSSEDENIQEVERFEENLGLQKNIKNLIKDVKAALKRIENGEYGICEVCGQKIESGRLKIFASAAKCVSCSRKK